jgi:AbrB family looped-hinge helix DNA binding protein
MIFRASIDKAGRLVLPKRLRDELQLSPGDMLELDNQDGQVVLRPVHDTATLRKERGIWVHRAGRPLSTEAVDDALRRGRQEREGRLPQNS